MCKWAFVSSLSPKMQQSGRNLLDFAWWELAAKLRSHNRNATKDLQACVHREWNILSLFSSPPACSHLPEGRSQLSRGPVRTLSTSHSNHSITLAVAGKKGAGKAMQRKQEWHHTLKPSYRGFVWAVTIPAPAREFIPLNLWGQTWERPPP